MSNAMERGAESKRGIPFRRNVGGIDRVVRMTAGAILFVAGLVAFGRGHTHALEFSLLGLFIITMAGIGFCPLYLPFGISTARGRLSRKAGE